MSKRRMPEDIPGGYNYVVRTDNYFQLPPILLGPTNGTRLGISVLDVANWHSQRLVLDGVYLKWSDKSQKTTPINDQIVNLLGVGWEFIRPRLDIIAASPNLIETDEAVFNLVGDAHHADPTHRETAITEQLFGNLVAIGGGIMAGHVRTNNSSKRNHIFADANSLVIYYTITAVPTPITDPTTAISKTFTKANFLLELGVPNIGKYVNYMMGWNLTTNTKLNGPLCKSQSDLIG